MTLGVKRVVIGGGVAAAGARPTRTHPSAHRAGTGRLALWSKAALSDATVELLPPTEAPGARGAAAIARHRMGLPDREGVGER